MTEETHPPGGTSTVDQRAPFLEAALGALMKRLEGARRRLERRIVAVEGDLARARTAGDDADKARIFVPAAAKARRGATSLNAVDWSTGEAVTQSLPLDPSKGAREQVDAIFQKARRLARGGEVAKERVADARVKLARLAALAASAAEAETLDALERLVDAAHRQDPALLPGPPARARPQGRDAPRIPYRAFLTSAGMRILVGKNARDNDELTLHVARPRDLWLHVKDLSGSHVVVQISKGKDVTPDGLIDAAHLAAHFSDARGESVVDVTYVPRRYVRKPRGSAPGAVVVMREKVLALRIEPARLAALLAREETR